MSSYGSPTFNFGGLASGLDTNTIVSQLLAIERRPQVRLQQRQRVEEARQTALRDVETRLRNLSNAAAGLRDPTVWGDVQNVESAEPAKVAVRRTGGAAAGGYTVQVVELARAAQATQGSAVTTAAAADTLRITVGGATPTTVDVEIDAGDTLETIATKINGSSGTPVYASVLNGKLVLSGKETGADRAITVADGDTGNAYDLAADLAIAQTQTPTNADFWIGSSHYTDRSSNVVVDVLPGVELTLKATTGTATVGISVSVPAPDSEAVTNKVQAFVEQYNSTIEFIRAKLQEQKVRDPSTDADRAKGVLRGDAGLELLLSRLRASVADVFANGPAAADQLAEVGLSTGAASGSATVSQASVAGKLSLDASKLSEQLAQRFGDVKALFTSPTGTYASEGLAQRLDRALNPWLKGDATTAPIIDSRLDAIGDVIDGLRDRQADLDTRLALRERALRAQFTAMESALAAAQAQGNWLQGQLAALL
jgi:flagellar hook-associated protein 2